jgi:hypothetical protein
MRLTISINNASDRMAEVEARSIKQWAASEPTTRVHELLQALYVVCQECEHVLFEQLPIEAAADRPKD